MSGLPEFVFQSVEEFSAVVEPGAEPLAATTVGEVIIPAAGIVLVYGSGGAGKTTLVVDLAFALATGEPWLGLVGPTRPLRVALVENEGPRAEFRRKLGAKLAAADGRLDGRIVVLEEPWAELTLAIEDHRRGVALALVENEIDLLVLGPLVSAGEFPTGGTPDEVRHFERHVAELRRLVERPFAILLVHHENRAGQVSGAWERLPDTLVHVTAQGNGRTRLFWQKSRWASGLHGTSTQLVWADGETFLVEDRPEVTEETIAEAFVAAVRAHPGESWTRLRDLRGEDGEKLIRGGSRKLEAARDGLLATGVLVNAATAEGRFELWLPDHPACPRSGAGTASERLTFPSPASGVEPSVLRSPFYRNGGGNGTARTEPELPLLGNEMYPFFLGEAQKNQHITLTEARELYALHLFVEAAA